MHLANAIAVSVVRIIILGRPFGELVKIDPYRRERERKRETRSPDVQLKRAAQTRRYTARLDAPAMQTVPPFPFIPFGGGGEGISPGPHAHACRCTQPASLIDFAISAGRFTPRCAGLWQFPRLSYPFE